MVSGILANNHQGCAVFAPFNGVQCTAIALVALLSFMSKSPSNRLDLPGLTLGDFLPERLDRLLFDGTNLYAEISQQFDSLQFLGHNQLPTTVQYENYEFTLEYFIDFYYGTVGRDNDGNLGQTEFFDALSQAVLISPNLLLTVNDLTVALHVDVVNHEYMIFDSHQRNENGVIDENGAAVMLIFESFDELFSYIYDTYCTYSYDLTPVGIIRENQIVDIITDSSNF